MNYIRNKEMSFKNTDSLLSTVHYRDAIYIDKVTRENTTITMEGAINSELFSINTGKNFIPIKIVFNVVIYMAFENIDYNMLSVTAISNFCTIEKSEKILAYSKINNLKECHYQHFVLSEYDGVYEIIAKSFELYIEDVD